MSGDAQISGRINIDPPVTWAELFDHQWAIGVAYQHYPDAVIKLDTTEENTADGVVHLHSGVAIVPTGHETSARTLVDDVTRIVGHAATAPDGTRRTFAGFLHVVWGGESIYRVVVSPGDLRVVEVYPKVVWPEGARDEDSVELQRRWV